MKIDGFHSEGVTRRGLFERALAPKTHHIASLYIQAWPDRVPVLLRLLDQMPGVDAHETESPGKILLVVETTSDARLMDTFTQVESADGVVSVSLVYHGTEDSDHV